MSHTATADAFDVGRVLNRSFDVMREGLPTFALLALPFSFAPTLVYGLMLVAGASNGFGEFFASLALMLISIPMYIGATVAAAGFLKGERPGFGAALGPLGAQFLGVVGLSILTGLAIMLGLFLLIAPGLFLAVIWFVAMPAKLLERRGPIEAMGRSLQLTQGSWLQILALVLIFAGMTLVMLVPEFISAIHPNFVTDILFRPLAYSAYGIVVSVVCVAAYEELIRIKEGRSIDEVFA